MGSKTPDDIYERTLQVLRDANGPVSATELGVQLELPAEQVYSRHESDTADAHDVHGRCISCVQVLVVSQQLIQESTVKLSTQGNEVHLDLNTDNELAEQKRYA